MIYASLFVALIATSLAIWPVCFKRNWVKRQRQNLDSMLGNGAGDGDDAADDIEEHRRFAVPLWLLVAGVAWFIFARSMLGR